MLQLANTTVSKLRTLATERPGHRLVEKRETLLLSWPCEMHLSSAAKTATTPTPIPAAGMACPSAASIGPGRTSAVIPSQDDEWSRQVKSVAGRRKIAQVSTGHHDPRLRLGLSRMLG